MKGNGAEGFEQVFEAHQAQVYRFALRLCGSREEAEDLAAEAFAAAFQNWDRFRGESSATTWLYGIVLNRWRMQWRRKRLRPERLEAAEAIAQTFQFQALELAEALNALPDPLREAFLLVKGEGLSHAEAAKAVGAPVGTMYFRVHQAVRRLRASLAAEPFPVRSIEVTCEQEL
ncbi:RNA polymerase sigma factor [Fimbriimonas ginsengisoli]|uniref:Putative RNA polymerase sigma factor n=1 Tax=Fimbriimonas ginsengisoli Gsoil 348 TaxID=661478 RepID=A0A068NPK9_FIMGI|nr:RNA polymerase sigma factor [Fimbriimonas ginsengisoli]AIE84675.1 putative RNA polymerase sigma factor [Fimbriimonas ginsengisoli Gsoil 348]